MLSILQEEAASKSLDLMLLLSDDGDSKTAAARKSMLRVIGSVKDIDYTPLPRIQRWFFQSVKSGVVIDGRNTLMLRMVADEVFSDTEKAKEWVVDKYNEFYSDYHTEHTNQHEVISGDLCRRIFDSLVLLLAKIKLHRIDIINSVISEDTIDGFRSGIKKELLGVLPDVTLSSGFMDASASVDAYLIEDNSPRAKIYWPFDFWNTDNNEMRGGQITIFAAPSENGKSWFAIQSMVRNCLAGRKVVYFSGEMTSVEIIDRMIPIIGGGRDNAIEKMRGLNFNIYDGSKLTPDTIHGYFDNNYADLVIIDHLHLMSFSSSNYRIELNEALASFKGDIANRYKTGMLILGQLKRGIEPFSVKNRPHVTDIRESSAIENIADWILLMAQEEPDNPLGSPSNIWCAKRRGGSRFSTIRVVLRPSEGGIIPYGI